MSSVVDIEDPPPFESSHGAIGRDGDPFHAYERVQSIDPLGPHANHHALFLDLEPNDCSQSPQVIHGGSIGLHQDTIVT